MRNADPFFWFLKEVVLREFLRSDLTDPEKEFVMENMKKHRDVLWINLIATTGVYLGLQNSSPEDVSTIILALIAPVTVMGAAWFAVSFGSIPRKLIKTSMSVTFWMFSAFLVSLSSMIISVAFISPVFIWPALLVIYIGALISCIQYDTADALKAGLDEAMLKHSRAALLYYMNQGISVEEEKSGD